MSGIVDGYTLWMALVFIIGYAMIVLEQYTHVNKSAVAILAAIVCWGLQFCCSGVDYESNLHILHEYTADASQIIFFLLGALAIVETIAVHNGFKIITDFIDIRSKKTFFWITGLLTFFLSAVLDNLTTTIVMVSFIRRFVTNRQERLLTGGMVVIAANAGGAWTPIGDVTTTMLWIGGQVTSMPLMAALFLPSLACFVSSTWYLTREFHGEFAAPAPNDSDNDEVEPMGRAIFFLGIGSLVFVPIFRYFTGMPPFMGILFGLAIMWLVTDLGHRQTKRQDLNMYQILSRIDFTVLFFFLGILLCVSALDAAGLLKKLAQGLDALIPSTEIVAILIGVISAIVDNVPLVAASMGMYDLAHLPVDAPFWHLVAYCAGTGGSLLIIGSAAGVAYMSLEQVTFTWFLRKISFAALLGYAAGIAVFLALFR